MVEDRSDPVLVQVRHQSIARSAVGQQQIEHVVVTLAAFRYVRQPHKSDLLQGFEMLTVVVVNLTAPLCDRVQHFQLCIEER